MIFTFGGSVGSSSAAAESQALTGLDWDGSGSERRALVFDPPPDMYEMTYIWKCFQRQQVTGVGDESRYYTTFFWGNNGVFIWDAQDAERSYYGAHPYPVPAPSGDGKWEISASRNDFVERDDGTEPFMVPDAWYSQAFRASLTAGTYEHKFWIDLPSTDEGDTITHTTTAAATTPPSPCITIGQAPDNGQGVSWGGFSRWEEQNAILRGWQIYTSALTEAQILELAALDTDAEVLAKCSELGITSLWYLNMNPTPTDVEDKSGNGNDPDWDGEGRPDLWEEDE